MLVELNEQQLQKYVEEHENVIVFFHTPFCANCSFARHMLESVLKRMPFDITIVSGNLNIMPSLAESFQIMTVPLLLLIKNGKPVHRFVAFNRGNELSVTLINFFRKNLKE